MIQANLRKFAAAVAVGLAFAFTGSAFAAGGSELGTWKMNPAKSQTNNKGVTNIIEAAGKGVKVTVEVLRTDGSVTKYSYVANFDGKFNKIDGQSASGDEVAATRVDANTVRYDFKRAGKPSSSQTIVVSADGKTRTQTLQNADSTRPPNVQVYEKQ